MIRTTAIGDLKSILPICVSFGVSAASDMTAYEAYP